MQETQTDIRTRDGTRLRVTIFTGDDGAADEGGAAAATGRDLVLLHGWPHAGRVWRPLADVLLLGQRGLRIVAPDLRGFGDSDRAASGYTCAGFADDVLDAIAGLGLERYALAGHSMSGKIAQLVAARRPIGLAALALVAPTPLVAAAAAAVPPDRKAAQKAAQGDAQKSRALVLAMAARPLSAQAQALLAEDALRASAEAWNGWIEPMRDEDFAAEAGRIAVPTLVIGGEKDPLRDEDVLRRDVVARIPDAQYASLPNVGHLPHLEEPSALAMLLVNFLDRSLPASGAAGSEEAATDGAP